MRQAGLVGLDPVGLGTQLSGVVKAVVVGTRGTRRAEVSVRSFTPHFSGQQTPPAPRAGQQSMPNRADQFRKVVKLIRRIPAGLGPGG